jgi:2-polyprenyl-6-methoxyphenol hydroxylase-like FAD-dependent oxidoreductase
MHPGSVEIAGAGIAGLSVATVLARHGWRVRVHERGSQLREIGAGIYLWENALRALEAMDAFDAVTAGAERIMAPELRDNNRVAQREWLSHGRLYTVLRRDLHRCLAEAAEAAGAEIRTNSHVVRAHADGRLELGDGEVAEADLVIGADGVRSVVRDSLGLARSVRDLHDGCSRHLIRRTGDDPVGVAIEAWNGARRMGVVPCSPDWTYIFLCCPERDLVGRETLPIDRNSWLESFPSFGSQVERLEDRPDTRWASFQDVVTNGWVRGQVALIGDAAHAMSPNLGQAACVAMTNAVALGQALSVAEDVDTALQRWQASERPVVDRVQRYSRFYGTIGTRWPDSLLSLRFGLIWALGRARPIQRRIQFASDYFPSLDTQTDRAA